MRLTVISQSEQRQVECQLASTSHALEMVDFHNSYYKTARKPQDWLWEYMTYNPEKAVMVFAKDFEKIIASQGMIPIYLKVGNKTILTGKSENTLLLPAYRGTKLMQELYEYAVDNCLERGIQFIWGFTSAIKAFKIFGFETYPIVQSMVRPSNIGVGLKFKLKNKSPLWRRLGSLGKLILRHFKLRKNNAMAQFQKNVEYELRRGVIDQNHLEALFDRLKSQNENTIFIRYDQKYLKWSVREHPFIQYSEYQVYRHTDLKAYAIVGLANGIVAISDLTSEDENATSFLLYTILKDFKKKAAEFHFFINTQDVLNQGVLKQLYSYGFSSSGDQSLVVRDLSKGNNKEIFDIRNWHINGLWTEGYSM